MSSFPIFFIFDQHSTLFSTQDFVKNYLSTRCLRSLLGKSNFGMYFLGILPMLLHVQTRQIHILCFI
ncbi:hypothetical protein ACHAXM_002222 [Skeletonema potamos]